MVVSYGELMDDHPQFEALLWVRSRIWTEVESGRGSRAAEPGAQFLGSIVCTMDGTAGDRCFSLMGGKGYEDCLDKSMKLA